MVSIFLKTKLSQTNPHDRRDNKQLPDDEERQSECWFCVSSSFNYLCIIIIIHKFDNNKNNRTVLLLPFLFIQLIFCCFPTHTFMFMLIWSGYFLDIVLLDFIYCIYTIEYICMWIHVDEWWLRMCINKTGELRRLLVFYIDLIHSQTRAFTIHCCLIEAIWFYNC